MENHEAYFRHRSCYVNFAEHLLNRWNVNMLFPGAPNSWTRDDWRSFLIMVKAFGFNVFEFWVTPQLFDPRALRNENETYERFAEQIRVVNEVAHGLSLKTKAIIALNTMGPEWYFACPNDPRDRRLILDLWHYWMKAIRGTDIIGLFPGDPGGCNRNGCTHETAIDLALDLTEVILRENPGSGVEIGTWGTPFSGWGDDLRRVQGWDGSWAKMVDPRSATPETPCHIWNGKPTRARQAMEYLLQRLPEFPQDCLVAINLGFSGDGDATMGGDARPWAREIAKSRSIVSWDYSVSEGELVVYPHWRLPRMAARRREERSAAAYAGGICYTMSPRLNLLTLYAAGRLFQDPDADPDRISGDFCAAVFGEEHRRLGELFEAFEVVQGWGHYPRRQWSREVLGATYAEMIDRLESASTAGCSLPLCVDPETYRQDLLWFARVFHEMAGSSPDRERIRRDYWKKSLTIYDHVPRAVDSRAEDAALRFSRILE